MAWGADLRCASLDEACLEDACLLNVHLEHASLNRARLHNADLTHAFLNYASLVGAHLEGADLYGVGSLAGVSWNHASLDRTLVRRDQLGLAIGDELAARASYQGISFRDAEEAYLLLKNNFKSIGRYADAAWAYVKEQRMAKPAPFREVGWRRPWRWLFRRTFWAWLFNWFADAVAGYGETPQKPLGWGAAAVMGFALGYFFAGPIGNFWDALVYSLATFATFNLARPEMEPQGRAVETAASFQAILGIAVLALVVFTLGNRMRGS